MKKLRFLSGLLACTLFSSFFGIAPQASKAKHSEAQNTELVFVVDKSGSMGHLREKTIESFNSVIEEQKSSKEKGKVYVTTVMFNDLSEKVHDRKNIKKIDGITKKDYAPNGCTALWDAMGNTITTLSSNKKVEKNKVVFVVITDGYENASREFTKSQVKKLIDEKKNAGWNFVFLGANIDSASEGGNLGIDVEYTRDFKATGAGIKEAFGRVSTAVNQVRSGRKIDLDEDLKKENNGEKLKKVKAVRNR